MFYFQYLQVIEQFQAIFELSANAPQLETQSVLPN